MAVVAVFMVFALASCLKSPEEKSSAWVDSAQAAIERQDFDRAIIDLQNAIRATPKKAEAHYLMGLALLSKGEATRSFQYFRSAVDLEPTLAPARLKLAELLNGAGDEALLPEAEEHAKAALGQQPADPEILHALAVAEWGQQKTDLAIGHLKEALALDPSHLKSATTLALLQWSTERDAVAAEETMRNVVEQSSNSAESLVAMGQLSRRIGKPEAAEAEFRQAIEADPEYGPALLELAKLLEMQGRRPEAGEILIRLSSLPDKSYRTIHALFLFENGEKGAAIAELKGLLAQKPENAAVRSRLVDFYLQTNELKAAEEVLQAALGRNARDADALIQQGQVFLRQNRFEEAERSISGALHFRPRSAFALYLRAQARRGLGRIAEYNADLRSALEQDPYLVRARVELSQSLRTSKAFGEAFDVIDDTPPAQKDELSVLVERIWALFALDRHSVAKPDVEKALSISREPSTLLLGGLLALREKRNDEGRALLEEALRGDPANFEALNAIAISYASEGKTKAAAERVREQAARLRDSAPTQFALGSWLERTGDLAGARNAYHAAIRVDSTFAPGIIASARMDMLEGRWDSARKGLDGVLANDSRNIDALLALGMLEEGLGRYDAAIEAYRRILQIDPVHPVAKNNLIVRLSEDSSTVDEALMLAQQLKEAIPDNPEIDDTVGWVYFKKGLYSTAIQYFENAAFRSKGARVRYHLAMAYFANGNRSLGEKTFSAALTLDPDLPEAELARRMAGER